MLFQITSPNNKVIFQGKMVQMMVHTACSETQGKLCFLVYQHEVVILNNELFEDWKSKFLVYNSAQGSGGIQATSEYDYIVFSLDELRDGYDYNFRIVQDKHSK